MKNREQPQIPTLAPGEVHIWLASLEEQGPARVQQLRALLTPDEEARAARFVFEKDRRHFIVAHGILRILLARYLRVAATSLRFTQNSHGKPDLQWPVVHPPLRFNLSHSHELALYAFAFDRTIGVDIEYMRPLDAGEDLSLAKHFFSPYEYTALSTLPASARQQAFFHCWTRKEAYIKARGLGLAIPLDSFDVALAPHEPAALLASREAPWTVAAWSLYTLTVPADYAAALVIEKPVSRIRYNHWEQV